MKRLLCLLALALAVPALADSGEEIAARRAALDLAGAFSNDGFKIRDGYWCSKLSPKESPLIQVNLYAGNQYWFIAGAVPPAKKIAVTIFDETGRLVKSEPFADTARAAAGFSPETSGAYYIRVEEPEGDPAAFCLIYSYK